MKKLRAKIISKLKGKAGESLAEVLIALLIAALAMTMLASVISTTARIVNESKTKIGKYYDANNTLESKPVTNSKATVTINPLNDSGEPVTTVTVNLKSGNEVVYLYENAEAGKTKVYSYRKEG